MLRKSETVHFLDCSVQWNYPAALQSPDSVLTVVALLADANRTRSRVLYFMIRLLRRQFFRVLCCLTGSAPRLNHPLTERVEWKSGRALNHSC